jgi:spermidine synthase
MLSTSRLSRLLLLALFAGSGCAALIYEIVWFQLLELVIGSTAVSLGVLLGTYMGGMCIGSLILPRLVGVRRRPLSVYVLLELGIGLTGLLVLFMVPWAGRLYMEFVGYGFAGILLRGTMCMVCLLPPTMLMGATLPVVARWLDTSPQGVSWIGGLYAGNIAGAVGGCLLAGFYLLRFHDLATATYVAMAVNGVVALIGWVLARGTQPMAAPVPAAPVRLGHGTGVWAVHSSIALSGLCALGAEVVWTRVMALMLGGSVYTFSVILAAFLTGLGLGSAAGAVLARVKTEARARFGWCQMLLAVAIAWGAFAMARWLPYWPIDPALAQTPWISMRIDLGRCLLAILPATILWGASFPLALSAGAAAYPGGQDPARLVGRIYSANTLGAILGALGFSLLIIPAAGTRGAQQLLIGLSIAAALILLVPPLWSRSGATAIRTGAARTGWPPAGATAVLIATVLTIGLGVGVPTLPQALFAVGRFTWKNRDLKTIYLGEGMNASVAVTERIDGSRAFHVSGKVEASTVKVDMQLQRMLGHISMLISPRPRSILVVGFGAGITAGSVATYPEAERIVICEIEPLIPRVVSKYFAEANGDVMNDKRVEIVYDDGRHFIQTTDEKFDVITSDPIHPWVKGSATLYTKEYFETAKRHLKPGGVVSQWVPLYETAPDVVKSEIATFLEVFPNATIWSTGLQGLGFDLAIVGQADPAGPIEVHRLQERLRLPGNAGVVRSLSEVGFDSGIDLLAHYFGRGASLRPWLKGAEINRDANLRLQYLAGLAMNERQSTLIHEQILAYREFPDDLFVGEAKAIKALRDNMLLAPSVAGPGSGSGALLSYRARESAAANNRGYAHAKAGELQEALASFQEALRLDPANTDAHANLGNVFLAQGKIGEAIAQYEEALRIRPDDAKLRENLDIARQAR